MVFIQFAGFTFGKSASAYATPWNGYPGNNNSFLLGGPDYVTGVNNIQYTAQFGNGVSATIGLDDPTVFSRTSVLNLGVGATTAGLAATSRPRPLVPTPTAASHAPDIVGNIRVDQAWGLFQISGALHNVNASYNILGAGGVPNCSVGNLRSPRRQVGRCGDGCVADQEHPDRSGRRHQDRRHLRQGCDQGRDLHVRRLRRASRCSVEPAVRVLTRASASAKRLMRFTCPGSLPAVLPATSS